MQAGRILRDCSFDDLREEFCHVRLTTVAGELPAVLPFDDVLHCERNDGQAVVTVRNLSEQRLEELGQGLNCRMEMQPLSLEEIYKIVVS